MAAPNSRSTLIDYCLRSLGAPVVEINVDEDQVEDRIDEALQLYQHYHADAIEKVFLKHPVTADDITNGYITIPDNAILEPDVTFQITISAYLNITSDVLWKADALTISYNATTDTVTIKAGPDSAPARIGDIRPE